MSRQVFAFVSLLAASLLSACGDTVGPIEVVEDSIPVVDTITFESLSAGGDSNCGLTTSGRAYCWGLGHHGQLGDGTLSDRWVPAAVTGGLTFDAVSAGPTVTCGVTTSRAPYCWGGHISVGISAVPKAVPGGHEFSAVTVNGNLGFDHACGLTTGAAAFCWGFNQAGELGNGSPSEYESTPVAVAGGLNFTAVAAGFRITCGLTTTGEAYCWGEDAGSSVPVAVPGGLTFSALATGLYHVCGLITSGAAYCWGSNMNGRLGDGSTTYRAAPVAVAGGLTFGALAAGGSHTCGLTSFGAAYCWGLNGSGQLGDSTTTSSPVPVPVVGGLTFRSLSIGGHHSCGVTVGSVAYCWGLNGNGQLGTGDNTGPERCAGGSVACSTRPVAVARQQPTA